MKMSTSTCSGKSNSIRMTRAIANATIKFLGSFSPSARLIYPAINRVPIALRTRHFFLHKTSMTLRWYLTVTMISHQGIYYRKDLEPDILNDCLHLDMLKKPMFCQLNWGMSTSYVLFTHLQCSILQRASIGGAKRHSRFHSMLVWWSLYHPVSRRRTK